MPQELPTTQDLASSLFDAAQLFKQKAAKEDQILALQADIALIDAEIKASAVSIGPLSDALTAYAKSL